jgi:hypothetical protein
MASGYPYPLPLRAAVRPFVAQSSAVEMPSENSTTTAPDPFLSPYQSTRQNNRKGQDSMVIAYPQSERYVELFATVNGRQYPSPT